MGNMSGTGSGSAVIGILGKLGGRKFLMMIVGVVAMALHNYFNMDSTTVMTVGGMIATYILGQSYSDGQTGGATSSTTPVVDPAEVAKYDMVKEMAKNGTGAADITAAVNNLTK